jgi:hypothetical protein
MPFDSATMPPLARQRMKRLEAALVGIHISPQERATLVHLATGQEVATIRRLAAVIARARAARLPTDSLTASPTAYVPTPEAAILEGYGS